MCSAGHQWEGGKHESGWDRVQRIDEFEGCVVVAYNYGAVQRLQNQDVSLDEYGCE
jgi:hypothetical protein